MDGRSKARKFMAANGHGDQLKHVSTRVVAPSNTAANFSNQALEPGASGADPTGMAASTPTGMSNGVAEE